MTPVPIPRTNVLGVGVSAINLALAVQVIEQWIEMETQNYICVTGVHGIMESQQDDSLRHIHNKAGLVTPDGMPLVWMSKWMGQQHVGRVYGPDLMLAFFQSSMHKGYRHYLYGSSDTVLAQLKANLSRRFAGIEIVGSYAPPFGPMTEEEDSRVVEQINAANPDIVWVGLSTPKQERWMAAHIGLVKAHVLVGVGAAFDFHAGTKRQAPYWMQRSGLEWVFRLATEPRRLWRRYFYHNPRFILSVFRQMSGLRHYSIHS